MDDHARHSTPAQSSASRKMHLQAVTAAQLAETLRLSRSTVSIVRRGDAERRKISLATVARVLEAAKKHNDVRNFIAQSLRRQRSGFVSVIVVVFSMGWCDALMNRVYGVFEPRRYTPLRGAYLIRRHTTSV